MRHAELTRVATLDYTRADAGRRTVPVSLSSESPIYHGGQYQRELVLLHEPQAIDMTRAKNGLPMLLQHDHSAPIGIIEDVRIENKRLVGTARFGHSPRAEEIWRDVDAGILKNMSIGFLPNEIDGNLVTRWTPLEGSVVSVPADPVVGIGRSLPIQSSIPMNTSTPQHQQADVTQIRELVTRARLPDSFADTLNARGLGLESARAEILEELCRRDQQAGGHLNVSSGYSLSNSSAPTPVRTQMVDALVARMRGTSVPEGNPYRHARVVDLARESLERAGRAHHGPGPQPPAGAGSRGPHTTGDFPSLLVESGQRVLRQSYMAYQGGLKRAFRASTARDFRAKQLLMLGEAPTLQQVNEHGEFTHGSMAEQKSSYVLKTYGRIVGLTRQALINDDLDAFGTLVTKLGVSAAEFEASSLVSLLLSNPTMSDTIALFHASHGNLGTGAGSALQTSSLTTARTAMRLQKGLDGKTPIDATPKYLIVPAALESTAEQLLAGLTPNSVSDVNPFSGKLDLIVDPRLDATSATAWYLATDPGLVDTIEYSYLDSANGPEIMMDEGWSVDGVEFKVRLDFGAGAIDWRGLYKSNGA